MPAAIPRLLLLRRTLIFISPRSFSASAVPLDDAHYLSLLPAALVGAQAKSKLTVTDKHLAVLKFLKSAGLDDAHITRFVAKRPKVLFADVDNNLAPKFQLLQSLGLTAADVVAIFEKAQLLKRGFDSHLVPRVEFLRSILHSNEDVARVFKRTGWSLSASHNTCNRMTSIISILKDLGFTDDFIKKLILQNPQHFQLKPELIRQAVVRVKTELGVEYESHLLYFYALVTLCRLDTLAVASKFDIFKNFGWSMADILTLVRCKPDCLMVNDKKLNKGLDFLMKTAGFSPSYIAKRPTMLTMSIERRIIPRYKALNALKLKNLISEKGDFYWATLLSEGMFLKKYVLRFEQEAPDVHKVYLSSTELDKNK